MLLLFIFALSHSPSAQAQENCAECEPLMEVAVTNKGLAHILEWTIKKDIADFNRIVKSRIRFKDQIFDHSKCKIKTVGEAFKSGASDDPEKCLGLPDLGANSTVSGKTELRPFVSSFTDFQMNQFEMALNGPVDCQKFVCNVNMGITKLDLEGQAEAHYTDKNPTLIPKTKFRVTTTPNADLALQMSARVDPKTGNLNDLVFLEENKTQLLLQPGSLNLSLELGKGTPEKLVEYEGAQYREQITPAVQNLKSEKYLRDQVEHYVQGKMFRAWALATDKSTKEEDFRKDVEEELFSEYGSKEKLIQNLLQLKWPTLSDDKQIHSFMQSPPGELRFVPDLSNRMDTAHTTAFAQNAGFSNQQGFNLAMLSVYAGNQIQDSPFLIKDILQPLIKKEILPSIVGDSNRELRTLQGYWNQISKVPAFDGIQNPDSEEWIPLDTAVFLDQSHRNENLLRAQIGLANPACAQQSHHFSETSDDDFDLRTELGPKALQAYFNKMAQIKKLDFCVGGSPGASSCSGGQKIKCKSPPTISCQDGQLVFDIDTETKKNLFGAKVVGQIKAEIKICDENPCLQISDSSGHFKNTFLNTFFGKALQRGIAAARSANSNQPISIPNVSLKKLKTDPQSCNSKLDWDFKP